ncbi:ABC transporter ATP-binding protein [Alicyclobacillus curvatus]|nr:ABC transporter ATP-binding protein [Alicyclobacillus curvatus]
MSVQIRRVVKRYGAQMVLKDISLTVENGQFVSLLGPSGCGKTTLLNVIAGLIDIEGGEIIVDDEVLSKPGFTLPAEKRNIGMVFQDYALWPHMNVYDNIAFGMKMKRYRKAEIRDRVESVLETVDMKEFGSRTIQQLSGGQKQRIAIARALAISPRLMLMDEPLSSLDAKLRERMRWDLLELVHRTQMTTIYVTHDQSEALSMSHHVVLLHDGYIEQSGTPEDLYHAPRTEFAGQFVGASNILLCNVIDASQKETVLEFHGQRFRMSRGAWQGEGAANLVMDRSQWALNQSVQVMVRPHSLMVAGVQTFDEHVSQQGDISEDILVWHSVVKQKSYHGNEWQYRVELTGEHVKTQKTVVEVWSNERLDIGDACVVMCPISAMHPLATTPVTLTATPI